MPSLLNSHLFMPHCTSIININKEGGLQTRLLYAWQDIFRPELPAYLQEVFDRSMNMLSAMADLSRERGYAYHVLLFPAGMQMEVGQWNPSMLPQPYPESPEEMPPQKAIHGYLAQQGIAYFDLLPAFWGQDGHMYDYYLSAGGHWTAAGNQAVSDAVCKYVLEQVER
jgi:lysophospholipase L1-like esterase